MNNLQTIDNLLPPDNDVNFREIRLGSLAPGILYRSSHPVPNGAQNNEAVMLASQARIVCVDGLTGFPDAVKAVFPQTHVQLCIVHMVRNSTKFVSYKDLRKLCADLKEVYSAPTEEAARDALDGFGKIWNGHYPMIRQSWQNHWNGLCEFFKYPMRNPQGHLHHECHRVPELPVAESDAEPLDICER